MQSLWRMLLELWEASQVELHGSYSTSRVQQLAKYESVTNWAHIIFVLAITPLPCLVVTILIDVLPLADPSEGVDANNEFFIREFYTFCVMTFFAIHQFRIGVRVLPYPIHRAIAFTIVISAITVLIIYGLVLAIGFPLPFTILTVAPMWLVLTSIAMAVEWVKPIQQNPAAAKMVIDMIKLWMCDTLLASIYPVYFFIFTTLSPRGQTAFALLLPVIKLFMRNLFARMAAHLQDETPEIVVFNAEVFNSLFVSYCMQNAPSLWTTMMLMVADVLMTVFSLRDIDRARRSLQILERSIDKERSWSSIRGRIGVNIVGGRPLTTLERASTLLQQEENQHIKRVTSRMDLIRIASYRDSKLHDIEQLGPGWNQTGHATFVVMPKKVLASRSLRSFTQNKDTILHPTLEEIKSAQGELPPIPITLRYTCKVRRLLYMAEFLILLNYVEVVIPLVFSSYLIGTYYLPNRNYYAVFDGMDQNQLFDTLGDVMLYCSLQFLSLLLLAFTLRRMLGISPTRQLAFVLEKQFHWVQTSLVFWLFYNVQASLHHDS